MKKHGMKWAAMLVAGSFLLSPCCRAADAAKLQGQWRDNSGSLPGFADDSTVNTLLVIGGVVVVGVVIWLIVREPDKGSDEKFLPKGALVIPRAPVTVSVSGNRFVPSLDVRATGPEGNVKVMPGLTWAMAF